MTSALRALTDSGFDSLFHGHPDALFAFDLDGAFVRSNHQFVEMTGFDDVELRQMAFHAVAHPHETEHVRAQFSAAASGENRRYRTKVLTKSGNTFVVDVTYIPLRSAAGQIVGVIGIARDVGQIEDALLLSDRNEGIMRIASKIVGFGGWSVEVPSGELYCSDELVRLLGMTPGAPRQYTEGLATHPEPHRSIMQSALENCMATGEPFDVISVAHGAGGAKLDVRAVGEALRDASGRIIRIQGALYDISDVLERERAQSRLEVLLNSMLDQVATGICFIDRDWRFRFVNETGQHYLENPAEALLGKTLWEVYPDARSNEFGIAYRRAMEDRVPASVRDYYPPLGKWLEATAYPTETGIAIHLTDVTKDQETRLRLEENTERIRSQAALLDAARDAIFLKGFDNRISLWNEGAQNLYGWSAEEAEGKSVRDLLYSDPAGFDEGIAEVMRAGHWQGELEQVTRGGRTIIAGCRWQLVFDDNGLPSAILAVNYDITEFKRDEERKNRAQRMESLGTMAGGIAHDLNNMLTPILMSSQLLAADETDQGRLDLMLSIETGVKRGAAMIRQVLSFARGKEGHRAAIDVTSVLAHLKDFCRDTLPKSLRFTIEAPDDLWPIVGDSTQIFQVLVNLVTNARDAMTDAGTIRITARNFEAGHDSATRPRMPMPYIIIEVEDSGSGMDKQTAARVFEPFFTTKEATKGTGFGLATSLTIARSHGGDMEVYSEPGRGSRFQLRLPAASESTTLFTTPYHVLDDLPQGNGEHVLIVDDEATIRQIVRQALEANGYRTFVASNGLEAVNLIEDGDTPVDLVFTDMMMPVMDGAATAAYLMRHHPHIAVVAASGLNANGNLLHSAHSGLAHFLTKPFTTVELLSSVRDALVSRVKS